MMHVTNNIISNKLLVSGLCFAGGYFLNQISITINQLASKRFGLPIDIQDDKEYDRYTTDLLEQNTRLSRYKKISTDRQLGCSLLIYSAIAVTEEFCFRFLLEKKMLSHIFFPFTNTCISTLLFSAVHLKNQLPKQVLAGQYINTFFLGAVCSLARQRIGLIGSIFVHLGFNLFGFQFAFHQNLKGTIEKIGAVHKEDVIRSILFIPIHTISIIVIPFVLISKDF